MTWTIVHHFLVRLRGEAKHLLYRMLSLLPLPAQDKWSHSLQLVRLQLRLFPQMANEKLGPAESERLAKRTLHQAGRQLVINRFNWSSPPQADTELVRDTYTVLAKTLNLPSNVTIAQEKVTITTFVCPFLEDAKVMKGNGASVCVRVCGQDRSLFKGTTEGFPFFVSYHAPMMMGHGDRMCVKEIQVPQASPEAERLGQGRSFPRRPRYVRERLPILERDNYLRKVEAEAAAAQEPEQQAEKDS
ncbi:MAG: hypothetical protein V1724_08485 [Chloroflexota bacterium]